MEKIQKILAPTDLSELSAAGVRYALGLARALGAEVTVYHVVTYEDMRRYNQQLGDFRIAPGDHFLAGHRAVLTRFLKENFSDLLPTVELQEKVEVGTPDKSINEEAKVAGSDLIVISTHGRTGLNHLLFGSVTEKVVRHAPCPVLSIHPEPKEKNKAEVAAVA